MGTDSSEDLTVASSPLLDAAFSSAIPGVVIGPYELVRLIGERGMGQVWLAEQKQPVQRNLANVLLHEKKYEDAEQLSRQRRSGL